MGLMDEFLDDIKAIRKELNDTKQEIVSGFSGITDDYNKFKQQANQTVDELKTEAAKAKQDIKKSISLEPSKPSESRPEAKPSARPTMVEDIKKDPDGSNQTEKKA